MSPKPNQPNFRTQIKKLAEDANIDLSAYDRALILGQIAALLIGHPKIGNKIAFKGGAIMNLVDASPRLSKDLDSSLVVSASERISLKTVKEALSDSSEAQRIVKRIDEQGCSEDGDGLLVSFIICHPLSGVGEVSLAFSIHWTESILLPPVWETVSIYDRGELHEVELPVLQRIERVAEKLRAFIDRGLERDAYDLWYHASRLRFSEWQQLTYLVNVKIEFDEDIPSQTMILPIFDQHFKALAEIWETTKNLVLWQSSRPSWDEVSKALTKFRPYLPDRKD